MGFYKPNAVLTLTDDSTLEVCIKLKKDPTVFTDPGLQNVRLFYVGNAVNPKLLPNSIQEGGKALINIDSGSIQGDFIFYSIHRTRFKGIEQALGQTFAGYLIPSKVNNDSDWT